MIIFYAFFFTTFSAMIIYRSILYFKSLYHYKVESTGFCLKVVKLGFFIEVVTKKNDVPALIKSSYMDHIWSKHGNGMA